MVLLSVYNGAGCLVGRCDEKCYNAKTKHCDCVCHGHNHGKGLFIALHQTAALAKCWFDEVDEPCEEDNSMYIQTPMTGGEL